MQRVSNAGQGEERCAWLDRRSRTHFGSNIPLSSKSPSEHRFTSLEGVLSYQNLLLISFQTIGPDVWSWRGEALRSAWEKRRESNSLKKSALFFRPALMDALISSFMPTNNVDGLHSGLSHSSCPLTAEQHCQRDQTKPNPLAFPLQQMYEERTSPFPTDYLPGNLVAHIQISPYCTRVSLHSAVDGVSHPFPLFSLSNTSQALQIGSQKWGEICTRASYQNLKAS